MGWRRRLCARDICVPMSIAIGLATAGCSSIGGSGDDDDHVGTCALPPCGDADGGGGGGDGAVPGTDGAAPLGDFSEPTVIEALSDETASEGDPSLTEDALELYFSSDRTGGGGGGTDIWLSRRDTVDDPWGDPAPVAALNSADADLDPEVSADGLTLWLDSTRVVTGTKGGFDLFVSTRETRDDDWGTPQVVPEVNTADSDMGAVMDASKTVLVLHRAVSGDTLLYQATRDDPDGTWSDPQPLASANSASLEADAYLSPDGLTLFFNSTRPGGDGDWDLWSATRQTTTSLFTLAEDLHELNTEFHEANCALALGLRYVVHTSARSGNQEIYEASR